MWKLIKMDVENVGLRLPFPDIWVDIVWLMEWEDGL